jgi:hypothetical protein
MGCSIVLQELKQPELLYRKLGAKLVVGMPFKDLATSDTLMLPQVPPSSDVEGRRALARLQVLPRCSAYVIAAQRPQSAHPPLV